MDDVLRKAIQQLGLNHPRTQALLKGRGPDKKKRKRRGSGPERRLDHIDTYAGRTLSVDTGSGFIHVDGGKEQYLSRDEARAAIDKESKKKVKKSHPTQGASEQYPNISNVTSQDINDLVAELYKAAPKGVDEAKYKRCKEKVEAQGSAVNPYAVCAASLQGKTKKSKKAKKACKAKY